MGAVAMQRTCAFILCNNRLGCLENFGSKLGYTIARVSLYEFITHFLDQAERFSRVKLSFLERVQEKTILFFST
jgi:hypothetical protein